MSKLGKNSLPSNSWANNIIKVWDLESKKIIASFSGDSLLRCCAVASDGVTIVAGEASGQVHLLRLEGVGDKEMQESEKCCEDE